MSSSKLLIIDARVEEYNMFITSRKEGILYVVYDYYIDTYASLTQRILSTLEGNSIESVALITHTVDSPTFKLLEQEQESILTGVMSVDPNIDSWSSFRNLWVDIGAKIVDLMGCSLYMNDSWRYVLNTVEAQIGIRFRSSIDDIGATSTGANWILETDNINVKDLYFTEEIENWPGRLRLHLI
jgi:hypothetical protein